MIDHRTPHDGEKDEVVGRVERIRHERDEGAWQIVLVRTERSMVTAVVRNAALRVGEDIRLTGSWKHHRDFGPQFEASVAHRVLPGTPEGLIGYLEGAKIPGVGRETARRIVDRFGANTLEVFDHNPGLLRDVPGLGAKRLEAIRKRWKELGSDQRGLAIFLQSHGISPAWTRRIVQRYGATASTVIQENPYRLARDVRGIGFLHADRIAQRAGIAADDPRRIRAAVLHALEQATTDGHVYQPRQAVVERTRELVGADDAAVASAIGALVDAGEVVAETVGGGEETLWDRDLHVQEEDLARMVAARACAESVGMAPIDDGTLAAVQRVLPFALSEGQRQALRQVVGSSLAVLTGGPGTGKTTIIRAVVEIARARSRTIALAAPTGRASRRLAESTGQEARTIHRLLEYNPRDNAFARNHESPIEADLLIVDEASMLDQALAHALFDAVGPQTSVLLVGDVEQLPSVGPGNVLSDLIESGAVPVARLSRVFRQGQDSRIIDCAHAVREGRIPEPAAGATGEFFFVRAETPDAVEQTVIRLVTERIPQAFGIESTRGVQILVPMKTGPVGAQSLNRALRRKLFPGHDDSFPGFHVGDRVMQVRNNYDLDTFNGDIGIVREVHGEGQGVTVDYDDRVVTYTADQEDDLDSAYAITIHKSQGSEFDAVVLVLTTHHFKLLQRNLVYTGITRARRLLVIVGTLRALRMAIDGISGVRRCTRLSSRIHAQVRLQGAEGSGRRLARGEPSP